MKTATLGTISQGTMRPEDLIPAFAWELRRVRGSLPRDIHQLVREYNAYVSRDKDYHLVEELLESLMAALNDFAPPYAYFGAHPGDGCDYGYWLPDHVLENFEGLQVSDTSEVPADYTGEVMHVNDHGNLTLYWSRHGQLREIWAIV